MQANATLTQENQVLAGENERLRRELTEIGSVLDRLTGGSRRGGGRRLAEPEPAPRRTRKPITDPAVLERRRQALARARQARSEKLAAARAAAASDGQSG